MMADGAVSSLGARPLRGVWSLVQKPGLSKLDPEEFEADMRALAGRMVEEVLPRVCGAVPAEAFPAPRPPAGFISVELRV